MGTFEISKDANNGTFSFIMKARNGQVILRSANNYTTKAACINGIQSVQRNYDKRSAFQTGRKPILGKWIFKMRAANGQIIGYSEDYDTEKGRDNGIDSVKKNTPISQIVDLTL